MIHLDSIDGMQAQALDILDSMSLGDAGYLPSGLCLYDPSWHQGVIGILASRIKERLHRPVIAFAPSGQGSDLKGSARSVAGLHIRDALDAIATRHPGLIRRFGGHAMAAGLSLDQEKLDVFTEAFDEEVRLHLADADTGVRKIEEVAETVAILETARERHCRYITQFGVTVKVRIEPLAAAEFDTDTRTRARAQTSQVVGKAGGSRVQLEIAELLVLKDNGHRIGCLPQLGRERLVQAVLGPV